MDTRADETVKTCDANIVTSPGSAPNKYNDAMSEKIELQSRTLRQTVIIINVNCRRGILLPVGVIVIVAAPDFGS